jgi:nucleotide-binding universal stress UspA family protein
LKPRIFHGPFTPHQRDPFLSSGSLDRSSRTASSKIELKVLLATDFLASSVLARTLVASLNWKAGTQIEVLHVLRTRRSGLFGTRQPPGDEMLSLANEDAVAFANELALEISDTGAFVRGSTGVGDPASEIVERARQSGADLVVLGGRSGGGLGTRLGSVCAGVVDRARCAVMVARTETIDSLLFADDGSAAADAAAEAIAYWSILSSMPVTVASVVDSTTAVVVALRAELSGRWEGVPDSPRQIAASAIERRVAEFGLSRALVVGQLREGDASAEILKLARLRGADLIVLGTSRKAGVTRLLLGSVSRSVLSGFDGSVLVMRSPR